MMNPGLPSWAVRVPVPDTRASSCPRATSSSLIRDSPPQVPRKLVTKYRSARKPSCADAARCRRMPSFPSFRITAHCRKVSDSLWERTWISTRTG